MNVGQLHIDRMCSQQKATQMLRGEHNTWPVKGTYQVQMSDARPKKASKCPGGEEGWTMIELRKQLN